MKKPEWTPDDIKLLRRVGLQLKRALRLRLVVNRGVTPLPRELRL